MKVARSPGELERRDRVVAIGTFDGVHLGHRQVIETALASGPCPTVVTFDPHPRIALGYEVELLATLERRLELIGALGVEEALVVDFTPAVAELEPEDFVRDVLTPIGTRIVVAGDSFRFGRARRGDFELLRRLGLEVRTAPHVEGVSSTEVREVLRGGGIEKAARLLGRPPEVEGLVVAGDRRGGTLGFPTANLATDPRLLVPAHGIYAGQAEGHRAAISIGVNPQYGGHERRIEAFLINFEGDLYGRRLIVELWQRLREERAFPREAELVKQIARDVEATRAATRPS
jgi:riboflavin kinase / FMN adenylyltransferase